MIVFGGKQITLPRPNEPNRRPRRVSGPIAAHATAVSRHAMHQLTDRPLRPADPADPSRVGQFGSVDHRPHATVAPVVDRAAQRRLDRPVLRRLDHRRTRHPRRPSSAHRARVAHGDHRRRRPQRCGRVGRRARRRSRAPARPKRCSPTTWSIGSTPCASPAGARTASPLPMVSWRSSSNAGSACVVGPEPEHVVPVVPTAVVFDLGRGRPFRTPARRLVRTRRHPDGATSRRGPRVGRCRHRSPGGRAARWGGHGVASRSQIGDRSIRWARSRWSTRPARSVDARSGLPWQPPPGLRRPSGVERRALVDATRADEGRVQHHLGRGRDRRRAHRGGGGAPGTRRPTTASPVPFGRRICWSTATRCSGSRRSGCRSRPRTVGRRRGRSTRCSRRCRHVGHSLHRCRAHRPRVGDSPTYRDLCPSAYRGSRS